MVFLIAGPPVGALAFFLSIGLLGMGRNVDLAGMVWLGLFAVIYALPLSYLFGALPAAVAGLAVAVRQDRAGPIGWRFSLLIGAAIGLGLQLVSSQPIIAPDATTTYGMPMGTAVMLLTCLVATLLCSRLARRFAPPARR